MSPDDPEDAEIAWNVSTVYGGYLGETVIKNAGGDWKMEDFDDGSSRVSLLCNGIHCYPPEKVYKRLTEDHFSGVSGYLRALRAIISRRDA